MTTVTTDDPPKAPSKRVDLGRVAKIVAVILVAYGLWLGTALISYHRGAHHQHAADRVACQEQARVAARNLSRELKLQGDLPPVVPC